MLLNAGIAAVILLIAVVIYIAVQFYNEWEPTPGTTIENVWNIAKADIIPALIRAAEKQFDIGEEKADWVYDKVNQFLQSAGVDVDEELLRSVIEEALRIIKGGGE